jgi:putative oxidoreductase
MTNNGWYRTFGIGLLIIRVGLGIMYMVHGFPKIAGGPEKWTAVGSGMHGMGVSFAPEFWGFMAAISEFGGGICLILGLLFRPAVVLMFITMLVAVMSFVATGGGFSQFSHPAENAITFLGLFFIGPGPYSVAGLFKRSQLKN